MRSLAKLMNRKRKTMNYGNNLFGTNPTIPSYTPPITTYPNPANYYPGQAGRSVLPGRTVSKVEDIAVGEVPQDGSIGLFPQTDGSCIWAKSWTGDGNIRTMKFVPAQEGDANVVSEPSNSDDSQQFNPVDFIQTLQDTKDMVSAIYQDLNPKIQNGSENDIKED